MSNDLHRQAEQNLRNSARLIAWRVKYNAYLKCIAETHNPGKCIPLSLNHQAH